MNKTNHADDAKVSALAGMFTDLKAQGRAALVGYLPAGYPSVQGSKELFAALVAGGCDLLEVGMPFSDPALDGPVIQHATQTALSAGFRTRDVFGIVESITATGGRAVVMTYFNPVLAYGVDRFAAQLAAAGGSGVITPDLIVDEAGPWLTAAAAHGLDPIFLVAPSSSAERIALTATATSGFLYVASTMGVTGARDVVSQAAPTLVARCRAITDLPLGVGLGVRTGAQAAEIAGFADAVIVGSAFVSAAERGGPDAVAELARELAAGVREAAGQRQASPA
jgi:tryptophan synthase alpha chain